jgi:hypothetical protein
VLVDEECLGNSAELSRAIGINERGESDAEPFVVQPCRRDPFGIQSQSDDCKVIAAETLRASFNRLIVSRK